MPDDDARDERVAAWLEAEPLDDVTRRRLVTNAMRETSEKRDLHAARWIAAAAAIVVVLVGVLALVTAQGGGDEPQAATPARTPASGAPSAAASGAGAQADSGAPAAPYAASAAPAAVDVGAFGNLDRASNLGRLRTALEDAPGSLAAKGAERAAGDSSALAALGALPCRTGLPVGTILAVGSGTLDGRAAVVVLTDPGDGARSIDAVLADPCEVRPLS
jgi:hypothetical protein